jgi:hypothetical protein
MFLDRFQSAYHWGKGESNWITLRASFWDTSFLIAIFTALYVVFKTRTMGFKSTKCKLA